MTLQKATDDPNRIRRGYLLAFGRPANDDEIALGKRSLSKMDKAEEAASNKPKRWERYTQALMARNVFLYVD